MVRMLTLLAIELLDLPLILHGQFQIQWNGHEEDEDHRDNLVSDDPVQLGMRVCECKEKKESGGIEQQQSRPQPLAAVKVHLALQFVAEVLERRLRHLRRS